jgi:hypothetical protein
MAYVVNKINGLSSTLQSIEKACHYIEKYGALIRPFVPSEQRTVYDNAVTGLTALCNILKIVARDQITEVS